MQTAVTVFERRRRRSGGDDGGIGDVAAAVERVHLHAQLHYGTTEYFEYYNGSKNGKKNGRSSDDFEGGHDAILYELLLDEDLLVERRRRRGEGEDGDEGLPTGLRQLKPGTAIRASPGDRRLAEQYGWVCQADAVGYGGGGVEGGDGNNDPQAGENARRKGKWIHADVTRQELLAELDGDEGTEKGAGEEAPLWKKVAAASKQRKSPSILPPFLASGAASEAATALLVGPPVASAGFYDFDGNNGSGMGYLGSTSRAFRESVFSRTVSILRSALWLTVPAPEVPILLLDWSALFVAGSGGGGGSRKGGSRAAARLGSPLVFELLQQLVRGNLQAVRRLNFGQVVLAGRNGNGDDALLVKHRNRRAVSVLERVLKQHEEEQSTTSNDSVDVALLYGCHHCRDLHDRLVRMGFEPTSKRWRVAFEVPRVRSTSLSSSALDRSTSVESFLSSWTSSIVTNRTAWGIMVLLISYLAIGGMDWIATWQDVIEHNGAPSDVLSDAALYLVRHVMLYVGISKLLLDTNWDATTTMNE